MDPLRLILIFIGLAIVAGIYLYYRDPKEASEQYEDSPSIMSRLKSMFGFDNASSAEEERIGPAISDEDFEQLGSIVASRSDKNTETLGEDIHIGWDDSVDVDPGEQLVLVFHILARDGLMFSGDEIMSVTEQAGFRHGAMQIFHYYGDQKVTEGNAICSIANAIEPGNFELVNIRSLSTPGVSVFMQLPGPIEGKQALELTLDKAKELSQFLNGELCDESRNLLTEQSIAHMREKVDAFRFKQQVAAKKLRRHD